MADPVRRLLIWYSAVSLLALVLFGWDKLMAIRRRRRIPEVGLLAVSLLGGGVGGLLGMLLFRHKIRKRLFPIWVGVCLFLQAALLATVFFYM